jgi:hypothetical protein
MREYTRTVTPAVVSAVAVAVTVEALLVLCTQDKSVMAVTPWQDDPYHAWVSLVVFALPALLAVTALRSVGAWLPWGRSNAAGRRRDLVRSGLVMTALVGATVLDCWLSVLLGEHRASWDRRTTWLLVVLAAMTVAVPVVAWLGLRDLRALPRERDADWVGDVLPARLAAWVRRHDRLVFLTASVVAAVAIVGALAYGERWTDPLLIGWAVAVEITCYYAFCVLTNAVLGFIDRPERERRTERAVVIGSLVGQVAVALHDQLAAWVGMAPLDTATQLVEVTAVPGLVAFAGAFVVLRVRPAAPARPAR